jgi:hypothetical protein
MSAEIGLRSRGTQLNLVILVSLGLSIYPCLLSPTLAQEEAPREMIAMAQSMAGFRFESDLKVGDWIKYQTSQGGTVAICNLEVTREEGGNLWIHEDSGGMVVDMLVDLKAGRLIKIERVNRAGERASVPLLPPEQVNQMAGMFQMQASQGPVTNWAKGEGTERVEVPAGTYTCVFLEPVLRPDALAQMPADYARNVRAQSRVYLCDEVPRLIPLNVAMNWAAFPAAFQSVQGGIVASNWAEMGLKLLEFGRK